MTSPARVRANALNALRSTGPRSAAGLARSAQNALTGGLFSRLLVVPALGESAEACDAFRTSIVADLAPTGPLEAELADRVAQVMWRLRRVARSEAAAMAPGAQLPPHPDAVVPLTGNAVFFPDPPDPPPERRLARLRTTLLGADVRLEALRAEATVLDAGRRANEPVGGGTACSLFGAAAEELGWPHRPSPWPPVFATLRLKRGEIVLMKWTVGRVRRVLRGAADAGRREYGALLAGVRARLGAAAAEYEVRTGESRREEASLAEHMLRARQAAAAARLLADDGLIQRVARAESHLSRELVRALATLAAMRRPDASRDPSGLGFVLQNGVPAGRPGEEPPAPQAEEVNRNETGPNY